MKMAELKISQFQATAESYEKLKLADKDGVDKALATLAGNGDLPARLEAVQTRLVELADMEPKGKKEEEKVTHMCHSYLLQHHCSTRAPHLGHNVRAPLCNTIRAQVNVQMKEAQTLQTQLGFLTKLVSDGGVAAVVAVCKDALGDTLDKALGDTVTDHSVFDAHCKHFEKDYFEDMRALGIQVRV